MATKPNPFAKTADKGKEKDAKGGKGKMPIFKKGVAPVFKAGGTAKSKDKC